MEMFGQDAVIIKARREGERHAPLEQMFRYRDAQLIAQLQVKERKIDLLALDESESLIVGLRGTDDDMPRAFQILFDLHGDEYFILNNKDAAP